MDKLRKMQEDHQNEKDANPDSIWDQYDYIYSDCGNMANFTDNLIEVVADDISEMKDIEIMRITSASVTSLPRGICDITNLTCLRIKYCNELTSIPEEIGNCVNISNFALIDTSVAFLPDSFCDLKRLKSFELSQNLITKLPENFGNLKKLKKIDITYDKLEKLPKSIGNLTKLKSLRIWDNKLEYIPSQLGNLTNLEELDLVRNNLTSLPYQLKKLTKLTKIRLSENKLKNMFSVRKMKQLKTIDLEFDDIGWYNLSTMIKYCENLNLISICGTPVIIPKEIGNHKNIKRLNIQKFNSGGYFEIPSQKQIDLIIPEEIVKCEQLSSLCISCGASTILPKDLSNLTKLTQLTISNLVADDLPILKIEKLDDLTLNGCVIKNGLNFADCDLKSIRRITVAHMDLGEFPAWSEQIKSNQRWRLSLTDCNISIVTDREYNLHNIFEVNLLNNRLTSVPRCLLRLEEVRILDLRDNPINDAESITDENYTKKLRLGNTNQAGLDEMLNPNKK